MNAFPLRKGRNKTKISVFLLLFNTVLEVLTRAARQEKEIKCIKTGMGKTKLAVFTHEMILSPENPKEFIKKKKTIRANK